MVGEPSVAASGPHATWETAVSWLREQPGNEELVLAAYYDDPLLEAATRYWQSPEWAAVREYLPARPGTALDIGAGRGIASFALARDGFSVTALEPDPSDLVGAGAIRSLAGESGLSITVNQEHAELLPFADATFDVLIARAALHHARNLPAACREFYRVLKPGGRLLALREHVISTSRDLPIFLENHPLHRHYGGENAFRLTEYQSALTQAGLRIIATLAPFESPINLAPHTERSMQSELASRASLGLPGVRRVLESALSRPNIWRFVRFLLQCVDNRPGRLYSFVATRES